MCIWACVCHGIQDEVREHLSGVGSLLPASGYQRTELGPSYRHTALKTYLFISVCLGGGMCVAQCANGGQRTIWVSWLSFHHGFWKSDSSLQMWQQVPFICWAIWICLAFPRSVEDQTQVLMLTRKVLHELSFQTLCFSFYWLSDPQTYTSLTFKVNDSMAVRFRGIFSSTLPVSYTTVLGSRIT